MDMQRIPETRGKTDGFNPNKISGSLLMITAAVCYSFTLTGKWSSGAGIGAKLFPQLSLITIFLSGAAIFFRAGENNKEKYGDVTPLRIFLFMGSAVLFVLAVLKLGLATGTFLYLTTIFSHFRKEGGFLKRVILPALCITLFIWGLFTYFAQIVMPPALLF
jgi:hypothetical protein